MDIFRPDLKSRKHRMRLVWISITGVLIMGITVWLAALEPPAPKVHRKTLWTGIVKRGEMVQEVRGSGMLVPQKVLSIQSATGGTVEDIYVWPGATVQPDTILLELANSELEQEVFDLEWQVKATTAQYRQLEAEIEEESVVHESSIAMMKSAWDQARLEAEASESLAQQQLEPAIKVKATRAHAESLKIQYEVALKKQSIHLRTAATRLEVQRAQIEKQAALLQMKRSQREALQVRAGISGVLQQLGDTDRLEIGQRISSGAVLAKVIDPTQLNAEILIPESQAAELRIGQSTMIDLRRALIPGRVSRIDPAVHQGSLKVEIFLTDSLPSEARPEMSIDGTIEINRLSDVLHVGRMVQCEPHQRLRLFRISPDGTSAHQVAVQLGSASVHTVEIREGLHEGDEIILSDTSKWHEAQHIDLQ